MDKKTDWNEFFEEEKSHDFMAMGRNQALTEALIESKDKQIKHLKKMVQTLFLCGILFSFLIGFSYSMQWYLSDSVNFFVKFAAAANLGASATFTALIYHIRKL